MFYVFVYNCVLYRLDSTCTHTISKAMEIVGFVLNIMTNTYAHCPLHAFCAETIGDSTFWFILR